MTHFAKEYLLRHTGVCIWKAKKNVPNCDFEPEMKLKKSCFSVRSPETLYWVEDAVRQSRHCYNLLNLPSSVFPNFSFSETGSLTLLWPNWACASAAQGNSTKRQHLLWVNPAERTETRLPFFFLHFVCLFVIFMTFVMLLGSCSF